jgi:hypothetical protein
MITYDFASGIDEGAKMSNGESWKNVRYLGSYEEADALRKSLVLQDPTLQVKIKRCGLGGVDYVVKSRVTPELKAAVQEVEEHIASSKDKKPKKKV